MRFRFSKSRSFQSFYSLSVLQQKCKRTFVFFRMTQKYFLFGRYTLHLMQPTVLFIHFMRGKAQVSLSN